MEVLDTPTFQLGIWIIIVLGLIAFSFFVMALFNIIRSRMSVGQKLFWLVLIFMTPIVGPIAFFIFANK